jgi:hypothetical protein
MRARFVWLEKDRILFETNLTRKETVQEWQKAICEHLGGIGTTIAMLMFLLFEDNLDLLLQVNSCHVIALVEEKLPSKSRCSFRSSLPQTIPLNVKKIWQARKHGELIIV